MTDKFEWDYESQLALAKADLKEWSWDDNELVKEIQVDAASCVLQQISDDLREDAPHLDITGDDLIIWDLSGDHFMVAFNASDAIRRWMRPNEIDNDDRRLASSVLRKLADDMDRAIAADPDRD